MQRKVLAVAAVVMACMVSPALAQNPNVVYQYTTDLSNYTGAVGTTVTVNFYLTETLTASAHSIIGEGNNSSGYEFGVSQAYIAVAKTSGGNASIATATANANAYNAATPGFTGDNGTGNKMKVQNNVGSILDIVGAGGSAPAVPYGTTISNIGGVVVNQIFLGSMTVTVGSTATTYSVTDGAALADQSDQLQTGNFTATTSSSGSQLLLDTDGSGTASSNGSNNVSWNGTEDITNTFSVTPTVVGTPEPSSMLLCGLAISGLGVRAWRRRRGQATETEPEATTAV
jgi:hypothetical protein